MLAAHIVHFFLILIFLMKAGYFTVRYCFVLYSYLKCGFKCKKFYLAPTDVLRAFKIGVSLKFSSLISPHPVSVRNFSSSPSSTPNSFKKKKGL